MPTIAASVSDEDIRRKYYETAGYSMWITEMQLDPLQLIVSDDSTGKSFRVPVTLDRGEFAFGDPVEVQVQYVDAGKATKASAVTYASREESTKGVTPPPPPTQTPPSQPTATAAGDDTKEATTVDPNKIREALGLPADASDEQVASAIVANLAALGSKPTTPPTPSTPPVPPTPPTPAPTTGQDGLPPSFASATNGALLVDPSQLAALRAAAEQGQKAYRQLKENEAERVIKAAISEGKFAPSREQFWKDLWAADPDGTKATIEGLEKNVVPVMASGFPGYTEESETDKVYRDLYGGEG